MVIWKIRKYYNKNEQTKISQKNIPLIFNFVTWEDIYSVQ